MNESVDKVLGQLNGQVLDKVADAELAFKSFALFAIAVWPRCSDAARVVRSSVKFAPDGGDLVFRHKGTKELKVPILSAGIGIPAGQVSRVCPVRTLKAYLTRSKDWDHGDRVWCCTRKQGGKYLPVTEKGCTLRRWMRNMMTRVGIDPKWTGGSIRMAASRPPRSAEERAPTNLSDQAGRGRRQSGRSRG